MPREYAATRIDASLPEAEALEQHPDPLPSLRHAVEPAEEIEVLERGELPVHERLVGEKAESCRDRPRPRPSPASARRGR